ncbi:protein hu-li tai shao isoform X6 [Cylas formicarius]|uniref:protein hu-li tai shao isoform X6 n=1 Tax=Cylas formicarius TaxID=197179 RepID=UPI002958CD35|nr:protein hu-li tai shao isoform X6 [Cylas formicarius]
MCNLVMTDTSQADELPPATNGVATDNGFIVDDDQRAKMRPADIDADVREMERRKRVELIMNSKLFREELERIIETQLKDGTGTSGLLQQISDMVGVNKQAGNVFKNSSCVLPINDIRGIESMGYAKGEKILRCKLASVFRLIDLYGWTQGSGTLITARLNQDDEQFLVNPYGMLFHEITASSLIKADMQGSVIEQGTTNFSVNVTAFSLHAAVHAARPDLRCIIHVHTPSVVAVSALKHGLLPLSQESVVVGEISTHAYLGGLLDTDEKDKLARNLGPINKVLLLANQGALCCGETIEEAFFNARNTVLASESQLKLLPLGIDNLVVLNDEARKKIYDAAHRAPESTPRPDQPSILEGKVERKWRVGGVEFEALMRMLDNAGFRTGYIYRHPLVKGEPPKPRNDVEVPPAVSSLGYLLEEEELYRQGLWRKLEGGRKGHDRSRWLNSPNVYQKVEILETGTPDPKKITKWVAEGSPSHSSTPVKIDSALQFVPQGTNPKEFKQKQQQIKDYRRADKISAGPQSHILEGVTWEEARKMQDATVTQTGDQVVLMGAASKGIIQRGHQHNATVYKSPYAKNPFDSVTDEELDEYKKVVERKTKGDYDTDYSESEGLSSAQINKRMDGIHLRSPTSVTSETEEESRDEPQILRIETKTAPRPSQPEVVLSDGGAAVTLTHYRTNYHAGFPKGSYVIPNPVHFHIARRGHVPIMRPMLVPRFARFDFHPKPAVVTLTLKDSRSIAVDVSLDTISAFVRPFARALNIVEVPTLNSQGCQTAYMNNFERAPWSHSNVEYTPLYVDERSKTLRKSVPGESFEESILREMKRNMMCVAGVVEFAEHDAPVDNESLAEMTDEVATINSSGSSESDGNALATTDEGVSDLTLNGDSPVSSPVDDRIVAMGAVIKEFLIEQSFETKELIVFPELNDDASAAKFVGDLVKLYSRLYEDSLNPDDKNELRLKLAGYVLKLLERDDRLQDDDDDGGDGVYNVSDKIFTTTEFLSEILDVFFDRLNNGNFADFAGNLPTDKGETSTPRAGGEPAEVTSFKKASKSHSETYWIMIGSSSPRVSQAPPRRVINVDDILLRPPDDFDTEPPMKQAKEGVGVERSPIREQARKNLFGAHLSPDFEISNDSFKSFSEERGIIEDSEDDDSSAAVNQVMFVRNPNVKERLVRSEAKVIFAAKNAAVDKENIAPDEGNWMGYESAKF